jgi:hypothetical protein
MIDRLIQLGNEGFQQHWTNCALHCASTGTVVLDYHLSALLYFIRSNQQKTTPCLNFRTKYNNQSISQMKQAKSNKRTIDMIILKTLTIELN